MEYILNGTTTNLTPPSGLALVITKMDIAAAGSVIVATTTQGTFTFPGTTPLPFIIGEPIAIQATGRVSVTVINVGDQHAYRLMDQDIKPESAGL